MISLTKKASLLLVFLIASCSGTSEFGQHKKFVDEVLLASEAIDRRSLKQQGFTLHYAEKGHAKDAILLWLHGTPGAWTEIGRLMTDEDFLKRIKIVSVDRPGWGESYPIDSDSVSQSSAKSNATQFVEFSTQSKLISPLIHQLKKDYPDTPLYLGGHSWGASLAPYIAAKNAELVDGLVLFAGAYFPELAQPRWYHHLSRIWPINTLIGKDLRLANAEMFALPGGLEALSAYWPRIEHLPLIAVQGGEDFLVSAKNATRLETVRSQKNTLVLVDADYGHLWHIQRPSVLSRCVRAVVVDRFEECRRVLQD